MAPHSRNVWSRRRMLVATVLSGSVALSCAIWLARVAPTPTPLVELSQPGSAMPSAREAASVPELHRRHAALAAVYSGNLPPHNCAHSDTGPLACAMYAPRLRPGRPFLDTPNAVGSSEFSTVPGAKWPQPGGRGNPVNITYSYSNLLDGGMNGITTNQLRAAVEEALALWASVAPLEFEEVADSGAPVNDVSYPAAAQPNLRFGHHVFDGPAGVLAHAYFPLSTASEGLAGDLHFDNGESWAVVPGGSSIDFLEVCVHEIGHSLGLNHQNPPRQAIMNPFYAERYLGLGTATLFRDDRRGITRIYGPNMSPPAITQQLFDGQFQVLLPASLRNRWEL